MRSRALVGVKYPAVYHPAIGRRGGGRGGRGSLHHAETRGEGLLAGERGLRRHHARVVGAVLRGQRDHFKPLELVRARLANLRQASVKLRGLGIHSTWSRSSAESDSPKAEGCCSRSPLGGAASRAASWSASRSCAAGFVFRRWIAVLSRLFLSHYPILLIRITLRHSPWSRSAALGWALVHGSLH